MSGGLFDLKGVHNLNLKSASSHCSLFSLCINGNALFFYYIFKFHLDTRVTDCTGGVTNTMEKEFVHSLKFYLIGSNLAGKNTVWKLKD